MACTSWPRAWLWMLKSSSRGFVCSGCLLQTTVDVCESDSICQKENNEGVDRCNIENSRPTTISQTSPLPDTPCT
ncbi:hypothetical protein EDB19DRAFT_1686094 [Suillus lakei]|nr:hypothetical protein EDB19DRAFT_1686094 [Suillus lakei]